MVCCCITMFIVDQLVVLCPFQYTSVLLVVLCPFQYTFAIISACCISVQFYVLPCFISALIQLFSYCFSTFPDIVDLPPALDLS